MIKTTFKDFEDRKNYLTGSEIASVVKHFKNKDFSVYDDCDLLLSKRLWNDDDLLRYNSFLEEKKSMLFNLGKNAEEEFKYLILNAYKDQHKITQEQAEKEIYHFEDTGKTLACEELKISATPDFLVPIKKNNEIVGYDLIETKAGSLESLNIDQYKYQIAQQILLLEGTDFKIKQAKIMFYSSYKKNKPYKITITKKEIEDMQKEILDCIPLFFETIETKDFNFISCDNAIELLNNTYIETNIDLISKIEDAVRLNAEHKRIEEELKEVKEFLVNHYKEIAESGKTSISNGIDKISYVKEKRTIKDKKYFQKEIKKLEDKVNETKKLFELCDESLPDFNIKSAYIMIKDIKKN